MVKMSWGRRHRRGRRGRHPKPVMITAPLKIKKFTPEPKTTLGSINIEPAEIEAIRLVDLQGLSQEEAGKKMGVSRGTIWRFLQSGRKKVAQALTEGRPISLTNEKNR